MKRFNEFVNPLQVIYLTNLLFYLFIAGRTKLRSQQKGKKSAYENIPRKKIRNFASNQILCLVKVTYAMHTPKCFCNLI